MRERENRQWKVIGLMMAITLLGKVLGLARDMLLGHTFGTGMEATAFQAASLIPRNFFDAIFASAISASFIPIFNDYLEREGREEACCLSNAFITVMALLTALLSAAGMVFAQPIAAFFADGFDAPTAALCVRLLRILFPTVVFTGLSFSTVGVLQSFGEFNIPAALSVVSNGLILLYYAFLCDDFGVYGLAFAFVAGWAAQLLIQLPALRKLGYRYRPALRHPGLRRILALMLPVMVSTWIQPINLTISTKFASRLYDGAGYSALNYANTLYTIVAGIFVLSITNYIFPEMSRLSAGEKREELGRMLGSTLRTMLFLLVPMTVGLMVMAAPIVRLLYEWGEWDAFSTEITSSALVFLSLGMVGYGIQNVLSRAYYAEKDGRVPLITGLASIGLNLVLCLALGERWQVAGLALASTLSSTVSALLLLLPMARRYSGLLDGGFWLGLGKIGLSAALMGGVVYALRLALAGLFGDGLAGRTLEVALPVAAGILCYFCAAAALRVPEIRLALDKLRRPGSGHS